MANIIEVSNVSKRYAIGKRASYGSLREEIMQSVLSPFRRLFSPADGLDDENSVWALKDISFAVQEGEVLGVVGRNGAGKSTLLKILSRITGPTEGTIVMRGRVASLLEVGTGFHPELTGRENIFLNGALLGMRSAEIKAKFDEIVAFSEIERFLDTPVKRYSSGMYVRLAFAVAAHLEPEILIIDEVLAVGDAAFQKKCLGKMGDVARGGRTVLFVSHNIGAVRQLCSMSVLLKSGKLIEYGSTVEVISKYQQSFMEEFRSFDLGLAIASLPPDPAFRLCEVVLRQSGREIKSVSNGLPLEVELKYQVLQRTTGLRVYIDLCDSDETVLFRSFHDDNVDEVPVTEPGLYTSIAIIPANLLGPAQYYLCVQAGIHTIRHFMPNPGIKIPLTVEATSGYNRAYGGHLRGKLAPMIPWSTEKMAGEG